MSVPKIVWADDYLLKKTYDLPKPGIYKNTLKVDYYQEVTEANEKNNTKAIAYRVKSAPDLIVCLNKGERGKVLTTTTVHAYVKNIGNKVSKACKLRFYVQNDGVKYHHIPALNPGQEFTVTRSHKWILKGHKTTSVHIDYYNNVKEIFETNNTVTSNAYITLLRKYAVNIRKCSNE